jgi:nicotinamide mononucleotide transporter
MFVIFTIRENAWLWFFGIISSAIYILIFYTSSLYAYGTLYIYYVLIGAYGWYNWTRRSEGPEGKDRLAIRQASKTFLLGCIFIILVATLLIYLILKRFSNTDLAWADAFLTASGMVATWMLTQKIIEQWLFWIVIDIVSCAVMIHQQLYPSSLLFFAYTLLAVKGYFEWKIMLQARKK